MKENSFKTSQNIIETGNFLSHDNSVCFSKKDIKEFRQAVQRQEDNKDFLFSAADGSIYRARDGAVISAAEKR